MQINPTILGLIACVCSIAAFFIGQYSGIKKNGYEQGKRDAKIDALAVALDELVKQVKEWNMGGLVQRIVALEKEIFRRAGDQHNS